MGLREQLREKYQELDLIYGKLSEAQYEEETSSNPSITEWEQDQYNHVLGWLNQAIDAIDQAIDNIPYHF